MDGLTSYTLGTAPLDIRVTRPLNSWGPWAPLKGTVYESLVPCVSLESHHHAVYGWLKPLLQELGNPPDARLRKIQNHVCQLANPQDCRIVTRYCVPCAKVPVCYEAPIEDPQVQQIMTFLVRRWAQGYWCFVLEDPYDD